MQCSFCHPPLLYPLSPSGERGPCCVWAVSVNCPHRQASTCSNPCLNLCATRMKIDEEANTRGPREKKGETKSEMYGERKRAEGTRQRENKQESPIAQRERE